MGTFPENWTGKTIGAILREAREGRGISIEEAANVTRIGKNYLSALEEDLHEKLPNPAYVKGFLRIYAGFLGLSGDQLVARYDSETASASAGEAPPEPPPRQEIKGHPKGRWYIPLLLLVLVLVVSFFFGERQKPEQKQPEPVPTIAAPGPVQPVMTSATADIPGAPVPTETAGEKPAETAPPVQGKGGILKLKVNQDSLLTITIDNSFSQQYDLKAGDLIEWKGERDFTLDISNGGGVEAELNGRPLPPLGPAGKPTVVVVNTDGSVIER